MSHPEIFYFAYGSNLNQKQMNERCPESVLIGKARIENYKLDFTISSPVRWQGGGCADIVADSGNAVWGLIYKLSENDLGNLDRSEGSRYRRFIAQAVRDNGTVLDVYAYEVIDKALFKKPAKAYLEIIQNAARDFTFPDTYRHFLGKIPTQDILIPEDSIE